MMPGAVLTRDLFGELLDMARSGVRVSDMPTTEAQDAALDAVAGAAPNPPADLITAAWRAFSG